MMMNKKSEQVNEKHCDKKDKKHLEHGIRRSTLYWSLPDADCKIKRN